MDAERLSVSRATPRRSLKLFAANDVGEARHKRVHKLVFERGQEQAHSSIRQLPVFIDLRYFWMRDAPLDERDHARSQVRVVDWEANPVLDGARADRRLFADGDEEQARNTEMCQTPSVGMLFRPANEYDIRAGVPSARDKIGFANRHAPLILHSVVPHYYNLSFTRR